jgi:hypothetical protein
VFNKIWSLHYENSNKFYTHTHTHTQLVNDQLGWLSRFDVKQIVEASVASGRQDVLEFLFIHKRLPMELIVG